MDCATGGRRAARRRAEIRTLSCGGPGLAPERLRQRRKRMESVAGDSLGPGALVRTSTPETRPASAARPAAAIEPWVASGESGVVAPRLLRLLVTGGSGFIGSQLAQYAARHGHRVTVVSAVRNDIERFRLGLLTRAGLRIMEAALEDEARLADALAGQQAVVHHAAAEHETEASEDYFRRVNVEGTRALLELACKAGGQRFVYGSTIGVYGQACDGVLDELSPLAPDNPYGRTKAEAER